jgi:predicted nucleotidyltransferase/8-oxo-dGTP pyrophosphatase MutT (NUDIX family)
MGMPTRETSHPKERDPDKPFEVEGVVFDNQDGAGVPASFDITIKAASGVDDEYMAAVEAGDMAAAQRLVDEAAKAAGYVHEVFRGDRDADGIFEYHRKDRANYGIFTTQNRGIADSYARGKARRFYVRAPKVLDLTDEGDVEAARWTNEWGKTYDEWVDRQSGEELTPFDAVLHGTLYDYEGDWSMERWTDLQATAHADGYDAVVVPDWHRHEGENVSLVVFDANNIKLADAVVKGGDGEIVPPSKRFDSSSPDVRMEESVPIIVSAGASGRREFAGCWEAFEALAPPDRWTTREPWTSRFHHDGNEAFRLPFDPQDYVWSDPFDYVMSPEDNRTGYYRRGVGKWRRVFERGDDVPPVCFVYSEEFGWSLQDGNHRLEGARLARARTIPAVLGYPKKLLKRREWKEVLSKDTGIAPDGKCWEVLWADGRGVQYFTNLDAADAWRKEPMEDGSPRDASEPTLIDRPKGARIRSHAAVGPKFIPNRRFVHMSSDAESLAANGWDASREGTVGGSLYRGVAVTLPEYVDSWIEIAKLGGTNPVWVTLPPGRKMLDFYGTFGSKAVEDVPMVFEWAKAQGRWEAKERTLVAQYDEDGEVSGWMEDDPEGYDEGTETKRIVGFSDGDQDAIFEAYVEQEIPQACGVWYWDEHDPSRLSAPQGVIPSRLAGELKFSLPGRRMASSCPMGARVVREIRRVVPEATEIWFHGSRARGTERPDSDWDIVVSVPESAAGPRVLELNTDVKESLDGQFHGFDIQFVLPGNNVLVIAQEEGRRLYPAARRASSIAPRDGDGIRLAAKASRSKAFDAWFRGSKVVDEDGRPLVVHHGTLGGKFKVFDFSQAGRNMSEFAAGGMFFVSDRGVAASYADPESHSRAMDNAARMRMTLESRLPQHEEAVERARASTVEVIPYEEGGEKGFEYVIHAYSHFGDPYTYGSPDYYGTEAEARAAGDAEVEAEVAKAERKLEEYMAKDRARNDAARGKAHVFDVYLRIVNPAVHDYEGGDSDMAAMAAQIGDARKGGHDGVIFRNIMDALDGAEVETDVYVVFDPRQIKSAVENSGGFDPESPDITASLDATVKTVSGEAATGAESHESDAERMIESGIDTLEKAYDWLIDDRSHGSEAIAEAAVRVWRRQFRMGPGEPYPSSLDGDGVTLRRYIRDTFAEADVAQAESERDEGFPVVVRTAQARFTGDPEIDGLFYSAETPEAVRRVAAWLRSDPNRFVRMYHGTSAEHPVMEKGLLPTSGRRRHSYQSGSGYVYLSVFPTSAEDFARMAYPGKDIVVYAVDLTVRRLRPDLDQLRNKRYWGGERFQGLGDSLAESLVYGHGARVAGRIGPEQITPFKEVRRRAPPSADDLADRLDPRRERVPTSSLEPTETAAFGRDDPKPTRDDGKPLFAFRYPKGYVLQNGHHRLARAIRDGAREVDVLSVDGEVASELMREHGFDRLDVEEAASKRAGESLAEGLASRAMANKTASTQTPIRAYHGSGTDIKEFSYEFTGVGNDEIGSGFYFTTDRNEARGYTTRRREDEPKPGGEDAPTIHEVELDIRNPLDADATGPIPPGKIRRLLMASPEFEDALANWGDVSFEGRGKVIGEAVKAYAQLSRGDATIRALWAIANDFYRGHTKAFNDAVTKILGYDGIVKDYGTKKHYVAFRPDQIRIVGRERVASGKFDVIIKHAGNQPTPEQQEFTFDIDVTNPVTKAVERDALLALRPGLAAAANEVIDGWEQDEDGVDPTYGSGGVCDAVAQAMAGVLVDHGYDVADGGQDGDDHAYLLVHDLKCAFVVDIDPSVYETGGGYSWKKREGAHVEVADVEVAESRLTPEDVANIRTASVKTDRMSELAAMTVKDYAEDLSVRGNVRMDSLHPSGFHIEVERARKAGDEEQARLVEEYAALWRERDRRRAGEYVREMGEKADAAMSLFKELHAEGYRLSLDKYEYDVYVWHGTTASSRERILKDRRIIGPAYFSHARDRSAFGSEGASGYAKMRGSKDDPGIVMRLKVDPRDIRFNQGTGEMESAGDLVLVGRTWMSPGRAGAAPVTAAIDPHGVATRLGITYIGEQSHDDIRLMYFNDVRAGSPSHGSTFAIDVRDDSTDQDVADALAKKEREFAAKTTIAQSVERTYGDFPPIERVKAKVDSGRMKGTEPRRARLRLTGTMGGRYWLRGWAVDLPEGDVWGFFLDRKGRTQSMRFRQEDVSADGLEATAGSLGSPKGARLDAGSFCRGYCPEFAIALHEATGWPIVVFNELVRDEAEGEEYGILAHAACRAPDGRYADARGLRDEATVAANMLGSDAEPLKPGGWRIEDSSVEDLEASQEIAGEALEQARRFIRRNRKLWGLATQASLIDFDIRVASTDDFFTEEARGILEDYQAQFDNVGEEPSREPGTQFHEWGEHVRLDHGEDDVAAIAARMSKKHSEGGFVPRGTIVAYHGTDSQMFDWFDPSLELSGQGTPGEESSQVPGFWLTESPDVAKYFGHNVMTVEVNVGRLYDIHAARYLQRFMYGRDDPVAFRKTVEGMGYDGIRILPEIEYANFRGPSGSQEWGFTNYVIFDPSKAKLVAMDASVGRKPRSEWGKGQVTARVLPAGFPRHAPKDDRYVYHNCWARDLPSIAAEGMDAGSFSDRPCDFGRDAWVAVRRKDFPEVIEQHQYGSVIAYEPAYNGMAIPPSAIMLSTRRGRIVGPLADNVAKQASERFPIVLSERKPPEYAKGAIFGYTMAHSLKSEAVYITRRAALGWNAKRGVTHEEIFGLSQMETSDTPWTWIYDLAADRMTGYSEMDDRINAAALGFARAKARDAERNGLVAKAPDDESFARLASRPLKIAASDDETHDRVAERHLERYDSIIDEIVGSFRAHRDRKRKWLVNWPLVPAARLKKIWTDYAKMGFVRDEAGMREIADAMFDGVVRLRISNEISGHAMVDMREAIKDHGHEFTDKQWERLVDGMETKDGRWYVSDYGLPKLERLLFQLAAAETAEAQLLVVDQMLNVVHQRGDLAAMFVEGGSKTLTDIAMWGTQPRLASAKPPASWFGNSKVVGEDGQPLVVYHGSKEPMVERFSKDLIGTGITRGLVDRPDYGGFFFTSAPDNAAFFADFRDVPASLHPDLVSSYGDGEEWFYAASDDDGNIVLNGGAFGTPELAERAGKAHVRRYNAANARGEDMFVRGYHLRIENPLEVTSKEMGENRWSPPMLVPIAKDAGHDGVVIRGFHDGAMVSDVYVAFDPSQIRPAGGVPKMAATLPATPEELASMDIDVPASGSISPRRSFEWRAEMGEGAGASGHETLADLASYDDQWRFEDVLGKGWDRSLDGVPGSLHLKDAIKAGRKIRVFRAATIGGIMPGSYVTESLPYARRHGEMQFHGRKWRVFAIEVYPDELVSLGDPHEFIYVPRDPQVAHDRLRGGHRSKETFGSASSGIAVTGRLNRDTGVDDAPQHGHLDTQLFPECAGTKFDRDVVKKNRKRRHKRLAQAEAWRPVAMRMMQRDDANFGEWMRDLGEERGKLDLEYFRDFADEKYSLRIRDDGLIEVNWMVDDDAARVIGGEDVVAFHATSTRLLPRIRREGLLPSKKDVNRFGQAPAGVYVSLRSGGVAMDGYADNAVSKHGGEPVVLEIRTRLADLSPDPDDADIESGRYQYVLPRVAPSDILNLGGRRTASAERDIDGELIAELDAEYRDKWTPVESSAIREVAYFELLGMLEFKMRDFREYSFAGVPREEYEAFLAAKSKGRWFADFVRRYRASKPDRSKPFGIRAFRHGPIVTAVSNCGVPEMMAGDVRSFLCTFLGFREARSSGTHFTFVKPGAHPVTVSLEGDHKLNPLRSGFSRVLEAQLEGWSLPMFRYYWRDHKAWLRRAKQAGPDVAEREIKEEYARSKGEAKEDCADAAEPAGQETFDVGTINKDRLNVVMSSVPALKKQFDEFVAGGFDSDDVYQMIHGMVISDPRMILMYQFPGRFVGDKVAESGGVVKMTATTWGTAGSGVMYHCPDDGTILLLKRSSETYDPGMWGIPGGAVKGTEGHVEDEEREGVEFDEDTLRDSAHSEVGEEMGHNPDGTPAGSVTIPFGNFKYTTFRMDVTADQKATIERNIRLNWESDEHGWFPLSRLPRGTHPGVVAAVKMLFGGSQ